MFAPIIIGGNGHSGTRIFAEILEKNGVFVGIPRITRRKGSYDLFVKDKLRKWVEPMIRGQLSDSDRAQMRREFSRRLRLYFPLRHRPWGFKNPRTMFILPVLHEIFPEMKFVHVVRDGRDISLGNEFVFNNSYVSAYLNEAELSLSAPEQMILFWGRSNKAVIDYCVNHLPDRSLLIKFEDLCNSPEQKVRELLEFSGLPADRMPETLDLVHKPGSIGRWKSFEAQLQDRVNNLGQPYLHELGYGL